MARHAYDVVILGAGPAGLAAALYTTRARRKTILLEKGVHGGQIANAGPIENYPGFPEGVEGPDLTERLLEQALKFGGEIEYAGATELRVEPDGSKTVVTEYGEYAAPVVILTGGSDPNKIGVPGEEEFTGRGVSYCATCDGAFFKDQEVVVVGGGNSAIDEGLFLTKFVAKLTIVHRRDGLRADRILQERALAHPVFAFRWNSVVEEILGEDGLVRAVRLRDAQTGALSELETQGVFVYIGHTPGTEFVKDLVTLDDEGYIVTNEVMETGVPGLYAAGDVRHNAARQLVTAAGDGVTAAIRAERYLDALPQTRTEEAAPAASAR